MDTSKRITGYDLFKSIVAILLLILFLVLNRRTTPQAPTSTSTLLPSAVAKSMNVPSLTLTSISVLSPTATSHSEPTLTTLAVSAETSIVISTPTAPSSPAATNTIEPTVTPLPSPTGTSIVLSTSTAMTGTPEASACASASSHSRLQMGGQAVILRRLNFRSSPGIQDNWLLTNVPGTKVEVIGGPQCLPYFGGAYVWWQIKLPNGQTGWSAEGSQFGSFYFMEPVK